MNYIVAEVLEWYIRPGRKPRAKSTILHSRHGSDLAAAVQVRASLNCGRSRRKKTRFYVLDEKGRVS